MRLLDELGGVVAYEDKFGHRILCAWCGDAKSVWTKFDCSPLPPISYMRNHMVDAVDIDLPRPDGYIAVTCLLRKQSMPQNIDANFAAVRFLNHFDGKQKS